MASLPPKRYDPPSEIICNLIAETLPKVSTIEQYESQDFAKRLIELQDKKRKGVTTLHVSGAFPWLYQLGMIDYERKYMTRGGARLFLFRKGSDTAIKNSMQARPWVFNGKWHSSKTQEAIARGENPYPDFVEPPTKEEFEDAKAAVESKAEPKAKKKKKKPTERSTKKFVDSWTDAIKNLPSQKKKKSEDQPPKPKKKKKKRNCCEDPHVVRSKKTGKRWCKNCGTKYKPKKVQ